MKNSHRVVIFAIIHIFISCKYQTFSTPELNEEKMEYVNYYFHLLQAEEIEMQSLEHEWKDDDLPILIKNSRLVRINEENQLTNITVVDTLASLLWEAVENKENYTRIRMGFIQFDNDGSREKIKYDWIDYPTNILR